MSMESRTILFQSLSEDHKELLRLLSKEWESATILLSPDGFISFAGGPVDAWNYLERCDGLTPGYRTAVAWISCPGGFQRIDPENGSLLEPFCRLLGWSSNASAAAAVRGECGL